jgi:membrane protease YdiL (CAAX protease family)
MSMQPQQSIQAAPSTSTSALRQWITHHPVLAYLILAFVVAWTILAVPFFSQSGIGLLPFDVPYTVFVLLASILGLTGSAFTITALVDGRPGVRALAGRLVRWRVGIQWYLIAFFGLPLVALLGISTGYGLTPFQALPHHGPDLLNFLVQLLVLAVLVNLWEETGWTGFMLTRLQPGYGALRSSLLIAPCFGAIHIPLIFVSGAVTTSKLTPGLVVLGILELLVLGSVPWRVLAAWVYNNTRGSLLLLGLLHSSMDATTGAVLLPALVPGGGTYAEIFGAWAVVALLLVLLTRGRLAYQPIPDLQPVPGAA